MAMFETAKRRLKGDFAREKLLKLDGNTDELIDEAISFPCYDRSTIGAVEKLDKLLDKFQQDVIEKVPDEALVAIGIAGIAKAKKCLYDTSSQSDYYWDLKKGTLTLPVKESSPAKESTAEEGLKF